MLAVGGRKNQPRTTHTAAQKPIAGSTPTRSNSSVGHDVRPVSGAFGATVRETPQRAQGSRAVHVVGLGRECAMSLCLP